MTTLAVICAVAWAVAVAIWIKDCGPISDLIALAVALTLFVGGVWYLAWPLWRALGWL